MRVLCGFLGTPTPTLTLEQDGTAMTASDTTAVSVFQTWAQIENVATSASLQCSGENSEGSQTLNIALEVSGENNQSELVIYITRLVISQSETRIVDAKHFLGGVRYVSMHGN